MSFRGALVGDEAGGDTDRRGRLLQQRDGSSNAGSLYPRTSGVSAVAKSMGAGVFAAEVSVIISYQRLSCGLVDSEKMSQAAMNMAAITGPMTKPLSPNVARPPNVEISTT